jgi:tetratricopeptide (TPR) repeat protein
MNGKIIKLIIYVFANLLLLSCGNTNQPAVAAKKKREFANVLYNQQLPLQAVKEYEEYLRNYDLDPRERANISYQIANIYFDRINDYENALAYYLRIKYLYPESNLQQEVGRKIVACLERLQRSTEAQQAIEQTSALDESQKPQSYPGETVASIGDRKITTGDIQYELNKLPPYMQSQLETRESKIEFLKQYIAQ